MTARDVFGKIAPWRNIRTARRLPMRWSGCCGEARIELKMKNIEQEFFALDSGW
jgi:hypothetical protein